MDIFDVFEIKQVTDFIPDVFEDDPSVATDQCLDYLAQGLLDTLKTTRSNKVKREIVKGFTTYAICSGMLISNRRVAFDGMLLRDNTSGPLH